MNSIWYLIVFLSIQLSICLNKQTLNSNHLYATKTTYHQAYYNLLNHDYQIENIRHQLNQCKPKMFYMICRHATRYPSKKKITKMQDKIYLFRDKLIFNNQLNDDQIERFKNWKLRMKLDDDNRISETGFLETRELARRLKRNYPLFFDLNKTNLKLYTTFKPRTNETAYAFFDEIYKNRSFEPTIKQHLVFHNECKKLLINNGIKLQDPKIIDDLIASDAVLQMRAKLANKIGIKIDKFDFKSLKLIYITCSFEYALFNDTLWCDLFDKQDLQMMEYIIDLQSYLIGGYGRSINSRMACPILIDLIEHINESMENSKLITSLQFSHSGIFKRMYAMFGLFKEFGSSHCRSGIHCFNEWRSSLILPFLANIEFLLYDCSSNNLTLNHSLATSSDYRLIVKIQENFVKIDGCDDYLCPLDKFLHHYQLEAEQCDLNEICRI